jgi:dihydroorotate dehydrogenase electron transfer subunit
MPSEAPLVETATLISREPIAPGFWCVGLRSPNIAMRARAAQFVALDVPGQFAVRLPLGIWTVRGDEFTLLFREWGTRTTRFAGLPLGTRVSCIGPLGNEFSLPAEGSKALIAAGGIGVAPFWLLARSLLALGVETNIMLGARTKTHLVGAQSLRELGVPVKLCTDDGSEGFAGSVIDALLEQPRPDIIYGCGPPAMLRALCAHAKKMDVACEISMEETFGCSMGTCWGCVVRVRRGCRQGTGYPRAPHETRDYDFARVCADGTVFSAADVLWTA